MGKVEEVEHVDGSVEVATAHTEAPQKAKIRGEIVNGPFPIAETAVAWSASCREDTDKPLIESGHRQDAPVRGTIEITGDPAEAQIPARLPRSHEPCTKPPIKERAAVGIDGLIRVIDHRQ